MTCEECDLLGSKSDTHETGKRVKYIVGHKELCKYFCFLIHPQYCFSTFQGAY